VTGVKPGVAVGELDETPWLTDVQLMKNSKASRQAQPEALERSRWVREERQKTTPT